MRKKVQPMRDLISAHRSIVRIGEMAARTEPIRGKWDDGAKKGKLGPYRQDRKWVGKEGPSELDRLTRELRTCDAVSVEAVHVIPTS